jgi:hypothetical protein
MGLEPQCSRTAKPVALNELARNSSKCNSFVPGWLFGAEFDRISTTGRFLANAGQGAEKQ